MKATTSLAVCFSIVSVVIVSERTFGLQPVPLKAQPFALQDVRLLDGPFKTAMDRDGKYMLELDPDRLLHNFRVNAALPSTARPLGNWESPKSELRGHLTGHYLSACALMYASTGDERFRARADLLVRELAKCQAGLGKSGYLSAFPESFFDRLESSGKVWAPYYTLHKLLAGLLDAHVLCGNAQALEVATKFGDWVVQRIGRLSDEQIEQMLAVEHGGINEAMANLSALTGKSGTSRRPEDFTTSACWTRWPSGGTSLLVCTPTRSFPRSSAWPGFTN